MLILNFVSIILYQSPEGTEESPIQIPNSLHLRIMVPIRDIQIEQTRASQSTVYKHCV